MGKIVPAAVEAYLASLNRAPDPMLEEILRQGRAEGLPLVDAETGALLQVLATAIGARHVLEIGTAIGYSTLWLARALPADGRLFSFEIDPARAKRAAEALARAGVADRAHVMTGDASRLVSKVSGPFDLIFQDGAKELYAPLHDRLVALLRPAGLLVIDNLLQEGEVVPGYADPPARNPAVTAAIAAYNRQLADDPRLLTTLVPLRDGLGVAVKIEGLTRSV